VIKRRAGGRPLQAGALPVLNVGRASSLSLKLNEWSQSRCLPCIEGERQPRSSFSVAEVTPPMAIPETKKKLSFPAIYDKLGYHSNIV
jgi:hypothetical protein